MNERKWLKQKSYKQLEKKKRRFLKRMKKGNYYLNEMSFVSAKNSLYRLQLRNKPTEAELLVGDYLYKNKIRFNFQKGFLTPFHRIVDFYLPNYSLIIEVDGGYHKNIPQKDSIKDIRWDKERNIKTIRITNEEVFNRDFSKLSSILIL